MTIRLLRMALLTACLLMTCGSSCLAQVLTVPQFLEQQASWQNYADEARKLQVEGRYQSRAADSFRMDQIDLIFRHPSTIRLPDRIQKRQRIEVVGNLVREGSRLIFSVVRMQVRDTDEEQLRKRAAEAEWQSPEKQLELAAEYVSTAEFYNDDILRQEIAALRTAAITARKKMMRGDAAALRQLLQQGEQLSVNPALLLQIRYELALADSAQANFDTEALLAIVRTLPGWDARSTSCPESLKAGFLRDPVAIYAATPESDRKHLHRLLYIRVRLATLRSALKPDGSNGIALSRIAREELPSEVASAAELENSEIQWHLTQVSRIDRQELIRISQLMETLQRQPEARQLRERWLAEQQTRFGTDSLAGQLRTADEFLFVAEQWRDQAARDRGVQLLKQAWELAATESPTDVASIGERLKTLGWENFRGGWMTTDQITQLPKDDVQLAIREGRVVRGMTAEQVTKTLGRPQSISRLGNRRLLREFWNYEDAGLVIRLQRNLQRPEDPMTVDDVARTR